MSDAKDWDEMDAIEQALLDAEQEQADERGLDDQARSALLRAEDDGFTDLSEEEEALDRGFTIE